MAAASVGLGGRPAGQLWGVGWARCLRTTSGSACPRGCRANERALLLRLVWGRRGDRRARGYTVRMARGRMDRR